MPDWTIRMRCTITKRVICEDCTEEEARKNPWEYAIDEYELEQHDWTILDIQEDK